MNWCFAIINGRLAELYFEKKSGNIAFIGHAYVKKDEFTTLKEQRYIRGDTKIHRFVYRVGVYKRNYAS